MKKLKELTLTICGDNSAFDETDFETSRILISVAELIKYKYPNEDFDSKLLDINGNKCGTLKVTYQPESDEDCENCQYNCKNPLGFCNKI